MKRVLYASAALIALPVISNAQDAGDALRYSQLTFGGTARYMAMGGAFSAIGGDMSTLAVNPAGIGVFVKSQLAFSPGITYQSTSSQLNGQSAIGTESSGNVQNGGMILAWKNSHEDAVWRAITFGIVYNRTNDFNYQINTQGNNSSSSLLDAYTSQANGTNWAKLDQYYTGPAFGAFLMDTNKGGNSYFNIIRPYLAKGDYITQQNSVSTSGSMGETDISFGGNYKDKLYIGLTVGIPSINYTENIVYSETPAYNDTIFGLKGYSVTSNVQTSGTGVNLKLGVIYRVNDWARVALAVHTPSVFSLTEQYSTNITATYNPSAYFPSGGSVPQYSPEGSSNFTLTTPMRVIGGVAFVIHKQGILSADYEYVNYSTASISEGANAYSSVNQAISSSYIAKEDFHVGGEWVMFPFSVRAGYAYYGNPYAKGDGISTIKRSISGGLGVKIKHWFIDLAYVYSYYNENEYIYTSPDGNAIANNSNTLSSVVLTVGINF